MSSHPTLSDTELMLRADAAGTIRDAVRLREHERHGDLAAFAGFGVAFAVLAVVWRLPAVARSLARLGKWGWIATFMVVNAVGFAFAGASEVPMTRYLIASMPLLFSVVYLWLLGVSAADWASEYRGAMMLRGIDDWR